MSNEILYFNGINGGSGEYLLPPVTPRFLSKIARGEAVPESVLQDLKLRKFNKEKTFAPKEGVDPKNLEAAGWGVILRYDADPQIVEALKELLDLRREQAGQYYRELSGANGYRPGESKIDFLRRHGVGPGRVDPKKLPYYLLIVGSPEEIPYTFQYHLDVQFAVGRIHFKTLREYAQYARSVVVAETRPVKLRKSARFFGVQNNDDPATNLSTVNLVAPLAQSVANDKFDWKVDTYLQELATKEQLGKLIGGEETPALLFTASHGVGFDIKHRNHLLHQGALLCQDWPGPDKWRKEIPPRFYFSADDVGDSAQLLGMMLFSFACYSAGTPEFDDFAHQNFSNYRNKIAANAFLSRLPQRLLSHPNGGALAVVGHVDRAWGYSFMWDKAGRQLQDFESVMKRLLEGHPIGSALEPFNERYAEVATSLNSELEEIKFNKIPDDLVLAELWIAGNDARDYAIIGDPAVRLAVSDDTPTPDRLPIEPVTQWPINATPAQSESEAVASAVPEPSADQLKPEFVARASQVDAVDFGLTDSLAGMRDKLARTLEQFGEDLSRIIKTSADNASSLEVKTFVSDDLAGVKYERGIFAGNAKLCALTRINLDGDTLVCVPTDEDSINQELWKIHTDTVHSAQVHRAEMLKTVISAATGLFNLFKA